MTTSASGSHDTWPARRAALGDLGKFLARATPGPWKSSVCRTSLMGWAAYRIESATSDGSLGNWVGDTNYVTDADLIVALRNDAARLLADSERAEQLEAALREIDATANPEWIEADMAVWERACKAIARIVRAALGEGEADGR